MEDEEEEEVRELVRKTFEEGGGQPNNPKRRRLEHDALAIDTRAEALAIYFSQYDISTVSFTTIWKLIQSIPMLIHSIWKEDWFRKRVKREFYDAYYAALRPFSKEMHPQLAAELQVLSQKSTLAPYSAIPAGQPPLLWFLYYQRLRRMTVLFRENNARLFLDVKNSPAMSPYAYLTASKNALACGCYLVHQRRTMVFEVHNWVRGEHVGVIDISTQPRPQPTFFSWAVTADYLVYSFGVFGAATGGYFGFWNLRKPAEAQPFNDPAMVDRAKIWCATNKTEFTMNPEQKFVHYSNIVELLNSFLDIAQYEKALLGQADTDSAFFRERTYLTLNRGYVMEHPDTQNIAALPNAQERRIFKASSPSSILASLPLYASGRKLAAVWGPFWSVSQDHPFVVLYGDRNDAQLTFPGNMITNQAYANAIASEAIFQRATSMFFVGGNVYSKKSIAHASGTQINLEFLPFDWDPRGFGSILAVSGSKFLIRTPSPEDYIYVLDIEALCGPVRLINAPCVHCSLPSIALCSACNSMPYCSEECQQSNWSKHRQTCQH